MSHNDGQPLDRQVKRGAFIFLVVLVFCLAVTWIAMATDVDLRVAGFFYSEDGGWVHGGDQPWKALYRYGTVPGLVLILGCLAVFFLGFFIPRLGRYRKEMLVVVLTAILGAGLLVNVVLKPYTARPRPKHVDQFGGKWEFCLPCGTDSLGRGMSFPCGHCTMGFLFVTLVFCRRKSRGIAVTGGVFGLAYGSLLGVARAAQGAHFATDSFWALGVIVLVAVLIHYILLPLFHRSVHLSRRLSWPKALLLGTLVLAASAAVTAAFLTRRPYFDAWDRDLKGVRDISRVIIESNLDISRQEVRRSDEPPGIRIEAQGFGWINARVNLKVAAQVKKPYLFITISGSPQGYFAELNQEVIVTLPATGREEVPIEVVEPRE